MCESDCVLRFAKEPAGHLHTRVQQFLAFLLSRPERYICVVGHLRFLEVGCSEVWTWLFAWSVFGLA
mgnify:CR=1 FL=1